jgi:hypothetical protein
MLSRFTVMPRGVLVMLCRFYVMLCRFFGHGSSPVFVGEAGGKPNIARPGDL